MADAKNEPERAPQAQDDQETFLFMGKRIPLDSTSKRTSHAPAPKSQEAAAAGLMADSPTAIAHPASHDEAPIPEKSSFDFAPLAESSKPGSSTRIFMAGVVLLLSASAAVFLWHRFGSVEARILAAANQGHLVSPPGTCAYDLYLNLKASRVSPVTKSRIKSEVLPKLVAGGNALLKKLYDGSDLTEPEQEQLVRTYEWAGDLDDQDSALSARKSFAIGYRAVFRKAEKEALAALHGAFQSDSQWVLPFRELANLYARAGNTPSAEYFYQQAMQLDPRWVLPALDLGGLYLQQNRLAEAELTYRALAERNPTLWKAWYFLGELHEKQKKRAEAIAAYERAAELAKQAAEPPSSTFDFEQVRSRLQNLK